MNWFGLNWQLSLASGWGVLGLNLALEAEKDGRFAPVPLIASANLEWIETDTRKIVDRIVARERLVTRMLKENPTGQCHCDFPVIHSLGNRLGSHDAAERVIGRPNFAVVFFEDTQLPKHAVDIASRFRSVLAGSTWNCNVLKQNGMSNAETFLQGVDLKLFHPRPRAAGTTNRFLIFSGGKLEFRKGQDVVIAAFKEFRRRHSDAVLVTAWHNHWPKTVEGIRYGGHVTGFPKVDGNGHLQVIDWLGENGVPPEACFNVGLAPNHLMPDVYAQVDAAVFANRCEGGTNLVAMECLASGVPTILSANTGHLDLIDDRHCFPLVRQTAVPPTPPFAGTAGWGETDVGELVEALERVYSDRSEARRRADRGARFMLDWSWGHRYQELVRHLLRS